MAQKRRSNGWEPPSKRHHSEDDLSRQSNNTKNHQVDPLPELPHLSAQYEDQVFTHQGALPSTDNGNHNKSYERLEFLGDAYIELFASRLIWKKYPSLRAGKMSQLRESLVKNETLAKFYTSYGFDARFRGSSELRHNEKIWTKVRGDVFEAYVAAIVLSDPLNGFEIAEKWLVALWEPLLTLSHDKKVPDMQAKVQLAGKIGGKGVKIDYVDERPPLYEKGDQVWFQGVYLTGWGWDNQHLGSGRGTSRLMAGNSAAAKALLNTTLIDEILVARKASLACRGTNGAAQDDAH